MKMGKTNHYIPLGGKNLLAIVTSYATGAAKLPGLDIIEELSTYLSTL